MGKKKGRGLKNNKSGADIEPAEVANAPHSFVIHRGLPCLYISSLTKDFRRIMEPFTASSLRERKNNKIKDFVNLSGIYHVSHMCIFNKTKNELSFKVARMPRGPTLTFKVHQFTLAKDVIASMKKQFVEEEAFRHAPLIILNNFSGEGRHIKLMANTFQNMFPTINLASVQLSTIRRCVLISYNPNSELIDMRHFAVTVTPIGLSRGVKKVILGKVPNLSKCEDIADFITGGNASDSEYEDDETGAVVLPQTLKSRGNIENNQSAVKLYEIGPRLTLELTKIEDGLFNGDVLYSNKVFKTETELIEIKKEREKKKKLKETRRKIQNENVMKKERMKDEHKRKSIAGMKNRTDVNIDQPSDDDDIEYYKKEVGIEPEEGLFSANPSRKRAFNPLSKYKNVKKRKIEKDNDNKESKGYKNKFGKSDFKNDKKKNKIHVKGKQKYNK